MKTAAWARVIGRAAGRRAPVVGLGMLLLGLAACSSPGPAPVSDRGPARTAVKPVTPQIVPSTNGLHTVQRGDTLYAIAFANGLDHREIALWNRLESPDRILVGQVLRLTPPPGAVEIKPLDDEPAPTARPLDAPLAGPPVLREPQAVLLPYSDANWAQMSGAPVKVVAPAVVRPAPVAAMPPASAPAPAPAPASSGLVENWLWPAEGTLAGHFGAAGGKGIDIVGQRNAPVVAVAPGKVVYSVSGLRGYGQLLIVKHAGEFLSAYAHNEAILVKEGDTVSAGQKIARMGDSGADRVKLHFEIRRYGKPLDPLIYLPERS
ncbi:MAG: peptidoglycan DD-metalloendopeptidase family protein [Gammaproteobacteria bacterium]|nr:peptidoglycan DD-metalloendopeptidase family protein [Gammaproteobacteria bacterium]